MPADPVTMPAELPSGTVTFFFSDIEGSTRLLQRVGRGAYGELLDAHRRIIRSAIGAADGYEIGTEGDSFFVSFATAAAAVRAAAAAQHALAAHPWPAGSAIRIRVGIHSGEATLAGDDYVGLAVHRAARIAAAAHGGQVLVSAATGALLADAVPDGLGLRDLGEHRLKDLARPERLYQLTGAGLAADFPPPRTLDATPNNLPLQLTSFVGRGAELAATRRLLSSNRLLTLTGPGGTGKTRLALQLAAEVADGFPGGAYFVALAPIADPRLVASTIAHALGVREVGGRGAEDLLRDHLLERRLLLVLDNFEQVRPAAPLVAQLLQDAPELRIVVTSRAALRISGEQEYPVPPLGLPDPEHLPDADALSQYAAVALFIERALAVKPDFAVTNDNAPAVAEICARLDGLPLAIELAAARVKLLPPQAMLLRLERRLGLLAGGARDLPTRQQTLRGAIAWSHDLLDDAGRRLLARFAIFARGARLSEAERVCGTLDELGRDVLDGLADLVDQSLLRQEETDGESRFRMLATIREFALEQLVASGEAELMARRHAEAYLALAERAAPELTGTNQRAWLDRLEEEHDNLRAALQWAGGRREAATALRLAAALWRFWHMRGHLQEGRRRIEGLLAATGELADPACLLAARTAAGGLAYWQADMDAAEVHYSAALALAESLGDQHRVADARYDLSFVYGVTRRDLPRAIAMVQEALALYQQLGDVVGAARAQWAMAMAYTHAGRLPEAHDAAIASLESFRNHGLRFDAAWSLHTLGLILDGQNDSVGAEAAFAEALGIFAGAGDVSGIVLVLDDFGWLAAHRGQPRRALVLRAAAARLRQTSGTDLAEAASLALGRTAGRPDLAQADEAAAWAEGEALSVDEAVALALEREPGPEEGSAASKA